MKVFRYLRRAVLLIVVILAVVGFIWAAAPILRAPESTFSKLLEALLILLVLACAGVVSAFW